MRRHFVCLPDLQMFLTKATQYGGFLIVIAGRSCHDPLMTCMISSGMLRMLIQLPLSGRVAPELPVTIDERPLGAVSSLSHSLIELTLTNWGSEVKV